MLEPIGTYHGSLTEHHGPVVDAWAPAAVWPADDPEGLGDPVVYWTLQLASGVILRNVRHDHWTRTPAGVTR